MTTAEYVVIRDLLDSYSCVATVCLRWAFAFIRH